MQTASSLLFFFGVTEIESTRKGRAAKLLGTRAEVRAKKK